MDKYKSHMDKYESCPINELHAEVKEYFSYLNISRYATLRQCPIELIISL